MPLINPQEVSNIFRACMFRDDTELKAGLPKKGIKWVKVSGIRSGYGFVKARLDEATPKISEMLQNLPETFHEDSGGGWSFLNACNDKNGDQWTSFHSVMEELFCLGMAIGRVLCLMPKEFWHIMPGGLPYYMITREAQEVSVLDGSDTPEEF